MVNAHAPCQYRRPAACPRDPVTAALDPADKPRDDGENRDCYSVKLTLLRERLQVILPQLILLFFVLCLVGCGFHLRGPMQLAPSMHNLYLKSADPYGKLTHNLEQYLKSSGVHLTKKPQDASVIMELGQEQTSQQLLSVGGTQQTRQYNLILSVSFQLLDSKGTVLLGTQTVSESRTIPIQSNQILAGSNEANNLYNQMREAIIYDIMTKLSAQDTIDTLMGKPHEAIPAAAPPTDY